MEPRIYKQFSSIEDHHWWHQSRLKLAAYYIDKMNLVPDAKILDVGCGTGGTTKFLTQYGQVTGLDRSVIALQYAHEKVGEITLVEGDANYIDRLFPPNYFDLITFFNVIYHQWIQDDLQVLASVRKILKPDGHVLLTEPAYKILMRKHDILVGGKTRYRLSNFKRYFSEAGIQYKWGRYFNVITYPVCLSLAMSNKVYPSIASGDDMIREISVPPRIINNAMRFFMRMEQSFLNWVPVPIGVTLLVVGQKKRSQL
jgi:ubiquinone/menaquinone biosynthesis C-methylase UbiE